MQLQLQSCAHLNEMRSRVCRGSTRRSPASASVGRGSSSRLGSQLALQSVGRLAGCSPGQVQLPQPDKPDPPAHCRLGKPKDPNWLGFYAGDRSSFITQSDACDSRRSLLPESQREFQKEFMMIEEFHKGFSIPNVTSDPRSQVSPSKDTKRDWPGLDKQPGSACFSEDCSTPVPNAESRTIREERNESSDRVRRPSSLLAGAERRRTQAEFDDWAQELARSEQLLKDLGSFAADRPQLPSAPDKEKGSHLAARSSHLSHASGQSNICFSEKNSTQQIGEFRANKAHQPKKSWTGTGVQITPLVLPKPALAAGQIPSFSPILEIPEAPSSSRDRLCRVAGLPSEALLGVSPCGDLSRQAGPLPGQPDAARKSGEKRRSEQIEIDYCDDASENSNDRKLVKRIDMCDVQLVEAAHADDKASNPQRELGSVEQDERDLAEL